ncbi:tRNA (adenosine(37)-N6)-threonylcarbamoyltransferase complex ATPase subunit type 1 TsaE [Patescibacteria group bacterium]|nr:MAG: tRNA (adenosine(37)-N6)-threonylcarbamoyltransferase complex ATPase subunit type 1 TsaE [Patescibacteria group bacterium]
MPTFLTHSAKETQALGLLLAKELRGGEIICLDGELGAGKTTFTQGLLKELGIKGPYTSPTFVIMKHYEHGTPSVKRRTLRTPRSTFHDIYHIDAYRIGPSDLLQLGWSEITTDPQAVVIVEWSDRIKKILPKKLLRIKFSWVDDKERRLEFSQK